MSQNALGTKKPGQNVLECCLFVAIQKYRHKMSSQWLAPEEPKNMGNVASKHKGLPKKYDFRNFQKHDYFSE
jgi:hypothetical protein